MEVASPLMEGCFRITFDTGTGAPAADREEALCMKHEAVTCVVCCGVSCDSEAQPQVNGVKLRCVPQTCQKSGIL